MSSSSRYVKLGLFTLLGLAALVIALTYLGIQRNTVDVYHTYFDESVQGLDQGAIVKFRGVRIGKVSKIGVAPDHRLIEISLSIDHQRAQALELSRLAPSLRTQLVIFGITGVKLIDLDFADEHTPPAPVLTFPPPELYIPSQPSLLTSVEDDLVAFVHKLPTLVDSSVDTLASLNRLATDASGIASDTRKTMRTIAKMAENASRANVPRTLTTTLGTIDELGRRAADLSGELERSVRQVGDAARAMQDFFETLEREPDILLKGRARTGRL